MSGGSYDYAYYKIEDLAGQIETNPGIKEYSSIELRKAFKKHLLKVSRILKAIEWNDSGDGDKEERRLIEELLGVNVEREELITEAKELIAKLEECISRK